MDADRIPQGLRHLLHAVEALENRRSQHDLRFLPICALQFAADQEIKLLIRPAQLHVRLKRDRVVSLDQRIQQFVH